jgi:hypothetical protein
MALDKPTHPFTLEPDDSIDWDETGILHEFKTHFIVVYGTVKGKCFLELEWKNSVAGNLHREWEGFSNTKSREQRPVLWTPSMQQNGQPVDFDDNDVLRKLAQDTSDGHGKLKEVKDWQQIKGDLEQIWLNQWLIGSATWLQDLRTRVDKQFKLVDDEAKKTGYDAYPFMNTMMHMREHASKPVVVDNAIEQGTATDEKDDIDMEEEIKEGEDIIELTEKLKALFDAIFDYEAYAKDMDAARETAKDATEDAAHEVNQEDAQETNQENIQEAAQEPNQENTQNIQETAQDAVQESAPESAQETAPKVAQDTGQEANQKNDQDVAQDVAQKDAHDVTQDIAHDVTQDNTQEVAQEVAQDIAQAIAQKVDSEAAKNAPQNEDLMSINMHTGSN